MSPRNKVLVILFTNGAIDSTEFTLRVNSCENISHSFLTFHTIGILPTVAVFFVYVIDLSAILNVATPLFVIVNVVALVNTCPALATKVNVL